MAASANGLWDRRGRVATAKGAGFAGFCGWLLEAMGYSNQVSPAGNTEKADARPRSGLHEVAQSPGW